MSEDRESRRPRLRTWSKALLLITLAGIVIAAMCLAVFTPLLSMLFHTSTTAPGSSLPATTQNTAMFGQDAWHSRVDPSEQRLTYANVSHLVSDWTSLPAGGGAVSSRRLW